MDDDWYARKLTGSSWNDKATHEDITFIRTLVSYPLYVFYQLKDSITHLDKTF